MERVGKLVRRDFPRLGQARLELERIVVHLEHAFINHSRTEPLTIRRMGNQRIQRIHVAIDPLHDPIARDGGLIGGNRLGRRSRRRRLLLPRTSGQD